MISKIIHTGFTFLPSIQYTKATSAAGINPGIIWSRISEPVIVKSPCLNVSATFAFTTVGISAPTTVNPRTATHSFKTFIFVSIEFTRLVPEAIPALNNGYPMPFKIYVTRIQRKIPVTLPFNAIFAAIAPNIVHGITTNTLSPNPESGPIRPVLIAITASSEFSFP